MIDIIGITALIIIFSGMGVAAYFIFRSPKSKS